jgi:GTP cyclohydrolase I
VGTSSNGIVLVRDIDFAALSEDTLMPFYGRCHVAYLPSSGAVLGLSKLARITKLYAKRLQTQEQLGQQVLQCLQQQLGPLGVAVVLQAKHLGFGGADVQQFTAAANGAFAAEQSSQLQVGCCCICCAAPEDGHAC